jgi:hypothetical protein
MMPKASCVSCGEPIVRASPIDHDEPVKAGNIIVCQKCAHVMAFDQNLRPRRLTDAEIRRAAKNPLLLKTLLTIQIHNAKK